MTCYGRTIGRGWIQEWYETASKDAGRRTRALRKLGILATSQAMGLQVTPVGLVKMTLIDIRCNEVERVPAPEREVQMSY